MSSYAAILVLLFTFLIKILFIYFLEIREGKEKKRESHFNVWLPFGHPLRGTWPTTQSCALTGN